ncbi:hypothetical protein V2G26_015152 [Clonostachys chloroleuca]
MDSEHSEKHSQPEALDQGIQADNEKRAQPTNGSSCSSSTGSEDAKNKTEAGAIDELENIAEVCEGEPEENDSPGVVSCVLSRITSRSTTIDPGPPPDGGWTAWSQCIAVHFIISNSWGFINSFGTWQSYYVTLLPERTAFEISMIGSLTVFLLFFIGTFTGRLTDAGYFRQCYVIGSIFQIGGIVCTSFCTKYWQFILAQGLCIGIGNGFLFCPSLALVSTYFLKRRAIAIGITAAGGVTGGVIFPVMARQLLPKIGFPWTIRAIALVQLVCLAISNILAKPRIKPRRQGPIIEIQAFKELEYTSYAVAAFLFFWGVYFAFYYLAAFSRDGLPDPVSFTESLNLLLVLNGVGMVGRLAPNYFADRVGAVNIFIPVCATASLLVFCWMAVNTVPGLYAWSVFYGVFSAGVQSLFPAALSFLTSDLRKLGVRMGMVFTIVSFAVLTGPPIAGAIIDRTGGYRAAQAFSGSSLALGSVFLFVSKVVRMRKLGQGWTGKV